MPLNKNMPSPESTLIYKKQKQIGFLESRLRFGLKLVNWLTLKGETHAAKKKFRIQVTILRVCDNFTSSLLLSREGRTQALSSE